MADQSEEYSKSIQNFAKSLEGLMAAIVDSVQNKNENNPTEAIKKLAEDIAASTEMIETIHKDVKATKTNSDEILAIVKSIQKEKRKGMFERLSDKGKGKTANVAQGIKTIALMAGAILAIGKAFQIIGTVDFPSVIALSVALPLMAMAFNEIGENVKSPKESMLIAFSVIAMSAGIAISGGILSYMPTLGVGQLISTIGVAAAMGIAMYGLSLVADNLNAKEIKSLYLLAPVMPLVATGIFLSAQILKSLPTVNLQNTIMTSLAVTGSAVIFGLASALLNKVGSPKDVAMGSLSLVIASGGLALSSQLIAMGDYSNFPSMDWATGFGVSMLLALPSVIAFGIVATSGIGAVAIGAGILSIIAVSGGLAAVSHILALGDYKEYPDVSWALGVGASLLGFGVGAIALGALMLTGIGAVALLAGIAATAGIAYSIVEVSEILSKGTYTDNYPSVVWATGAAAALTAFAVAMSVGGIGSLVGKVFEFLGGDGPTEIAQKIVDVSLILSKGKYTDNYPSLLWATGAAASLAAFAGGGAMSSLASAIGNFASSILGGDTVTEIAQKIVDVSNIFAMGKYTTYPDLEWSTAVLSLLNNFSNIGGSNDLTTVSKGIDELSYSYVKLAGSINLLATATNKIKTAPNLSGLYGGLVTLSLIDADNLKNALDAIDNKSNEFARVMSLANSANNTNASTKNDEITKVMSLVNSANNTKIDDSSFAFNKDTKSEQSNINPNRTSVNSNTSGEVITTVTRPTLETKEDKTVKLMEQVIRLLSSGNGILGEIADNTAQKMANIGIEN